ARNAAALAAIMVDIDFFKAFNDHHGHVRGDDALRDVAAILSSAVSRPADLVARYGGEEFVLLLPDTEVDGAGQVAERLRADVEALGIPHPRSRAAPQLTISLGVAGSQPDLEATPGTLIAAADQALYWAKRSGRNCVRRCRATCPSSQGKARGPMRKVVVVDDDRDICDALEDALRDHGYRVDAVYDGLK